MITVVTPYYNRADRLPQMLESVAKSTFRPIHLILVDNGSTDDSAAICRRFKEEHEAPDFSIILAEEPTHGAPAARNKGLSLVTTNYVYFFDSDDDFDPDFLRIANTLAHDPVDLLCLTTNMELGGHIDVRKFRKDDAVVAQVLAAHLNTQSMVMRTDFARIFGQWNNNLPIWNDWEMGVRLLVSTKHVRWFTQRAFHTIHVHPDSITGTDYSSRLDGLLRAMQVVNKDVKKLPRAITALYFRHCIVCGMLQREHNSAGVKACEQQMNELFPKQKRLTRIIGAYIRRYVAQGGRGGWWLAFKACRLNGKMSRVEQAEIEPENVEFFE